MEFLLGGIVFVVVPLAIVVGIAYVAVRWFRQNEARKRYEAAGGVVESLRYHVPRGQDPAALLSALRLEGYEATYDETAAQPDVLVLTPSGADRERARVRSVIAHDASLDLEGNPPDVQEIRFADE